MKDCRTKDDRLKLTKDRITYSLKDVISLVDENQKRVYKKSDVYFKDKKINFSDIDFTRDCLFISDSNLAGIISLIGLLKINNINVKDVSLSGKFSSINKSYMISTISDARLAMVANDVSELDPDSWHLENYFTKDIIIWVFPKLLGTGTDKDSTSIINSFMSIYNSRKFNKKINWIFFTGDTQEFTNIYNINDLDKYLIKRSGSFITRKGGIF